MMSLLFLFVLVLAALPPSDGQDLQLQSENCPTGSSWHRFNNRFFKYVDTRMTWADAELHCVSQGANLVSIHSLEEHTFINALIKNFDPNQAWTWNGLTDAHKEGSWMWSDGSKVNFLLWDEGQPDNAGGKEHCGHTNVGSNFKWNDRLCSNTFPFVCASRNIHP